MLKIIGSSSRQDSGTVLLLSAQTNRPCEWIELNGRSSVSTSGQPILMFDDGRYYDDPIDVICALADGSELLPDDLWPRAKVIDALQFEQSELHPAAAASYEQRLARGRLRHEAAAGVQPPALQERLDDALSKLNEQLELAPFVAGEDYTVADIACYADTRAAQAAGQPLDAFPAIDAWLKRVEHQAGSHVLAIALGELQGASQVRPAALSWLN